MHQFTVLIVVHAAILANDTVLRTVVYEQSAVIAEVVSTSRQQAIGAGVINRILTGSCLTAGADVVVATFRLIVNQALVHQFAVLIVVHAASFLHQAILFLFNKQLTVCAERISTSRQQAVGAGSVNRVLTCSNLAVRTGIVIAAFCLIVNQALVGRYTILIVVQSSVHFINTLDQHFTISSKGIHSLRNQIIRLGYGIVLSANNLAGRSGIVVSICLAIIVGVQMQHTTISLFPVDVVVTVDNICNLDGKRIFSRRAITVAAVYLNRIDTIRQRKSKVILFQVKAGSGIYFCNNIVCYNRAVHPLFHHRPRQFFIQNFFHFCVLGIKRICCILGLRNRQGSSIRVQHSFFNHRPVIVDEVALPIRINRFCFQAGKHVEIFIQHQHIFKILDRVVHNTGTRNIAAQFQAHMIVITLKQCFQMSIGGCTGNAFGVHRSAKIAGTSIIYNRQKGNDEIGLAVIQSLHCLDSSNTCFILVSAGRLCPVSNPADLCTGGIASDPIHSRLHIICKFRTQLHRLAIILHQDHVPGLCKCVLIILIARHIGVLRGNIVGFGASLRQNQSTATVYDAVEHNFRIHSRRHIGNHVVEIAGVVIRMAVTNGQNAQFFQLQRYILMSIGINTTGVVQPTIQFKLCGFRERTRANCRHAVSNIHCFQNVAARKRAGRNRRHTVSHNNVADLGIISIPRRCSAAIIVHRTGAGDLKRIRLIPVGHHCIVERCTACALRHIGRLCKCHGGHCAQQQDNGKQYCRNSLH